MKKIGIVTYYDINNYGSFLQAYSMSLFLKDKGFRPVFLKFKYDSESRVINNKLISIISYIFLLLRWPKYILSFLRLRKMGMRYKHHIPDVVKTDFQNAIKKNLEIEEISYKFISKIENQEDYFAFICGSDQIWSPLGIKLRPHKFLEFASNEKKIAYAPSFGVGYVPKYNYKKIKKNLENFTNISVREKTGKKIIKEMIGRDVPVVLDPTLLVDETKWTNLECRKSEVKYVLCYFLDEPEEFIIKLVNEYSILNKLKIFYLPFKNKFEFSSESQYLKLGPFDFVKMFKGASFIFTDSFHGTTFSVIFEKSFLSFPRNHTAQYEQTNRIVDFLDTINLSDRFINYSMKIEEVKQIANYVEIKEKLQKMRVESQNYLINSLDGIGGGKCE